MSDLTRPTVRTRPRDLKVGDEVRWWHGVGYAGEYRDHVIEKVIHRPARRGSGFDTAYDLRFADGTMRSAGAHQWVEVYRTTERDS